MLRTVCVAQSAVGPVVVPNMSRGFQSTKCRYPATAGKLVANAAPRNDRVAPNAIWSRNTWETPPALFHRREALTVTCAAAPRAFCVYVSAVLAEFFRIDAFRTGAIEALFRDYAFGVLKVSLFNVNLFS